MNAPFDGNDRHRIGRAFSHARDYDGDARIQRIAARRLASRIARLPLPPAPRILEIGCGTGFLTEALIGMGIGGDDGGEWLITDIAPRMVERCRDNVGEGSGRRFAAMDGEYGNPGDFARFDLICSSLAFQWFDDQKAALDRMLGWLAPGGHCLFTTLAAQSFHEWRAACEQEGAPPGVRPLLPFSAFAQMLPEAQATAPSVDLLIERHGSALDFLRALRSIGATTAHRDHRPLSHGVLRRVMRNFEDMGGTTTYEVVTCHFTRAPDPR